MEKMRSGRGTDGLPPVERTPVSLKTGRRVSSKVGGCPAKRKCVGKGFLLSRSGLTLIAPRWPIDQDGNSPQPPKQLQAVPCNLSPVPYPSKRRITSVVFAPPKPNELLITTSSGWVRAVCGT